MIANNVLVNSMNMRGPKDTTYVILLYGTYTDADILLRN